ncbi:MAG: hypothetical protein ABI091_26710 [Ferruginibacter sp.]
MPQQLKYVAQLAMDNFYQDYKGDDDFWEIEDFISMCGNTAAETYQTFYQQAYAMLRQEKKQEVVSFDAGWLLAQDVEVTKQGNTLFADLDKPVMTFPYDQSSIGIQNVFILEPYSDDEAERTSLSQKWQLKYVPKVNKVFFYSDVAGINCDVASKISLINKGDCNIKKIRVLYVPVLNDGDAVIPDGIINGVITKTVMAMKQIASGNVIDQTQDSNNNKVLQTELDKNTLVK